MDQMTNLVLIGMPGAGKSTIGVILAKKTSRDFIDTDVVIQTKEHCSLQQILDKEGFMALRKIEERILLDLHYTNHVIATGGSAAYSSAAMNHLKSNGIIVFLNVELGELYKRIENFDTRGIARRPDQSFSDLFQERLVLYKTYADITIECKKMNHEQISVKIYEELENV